MATAAETVLTSSGRPVDLVDVPSIEAAEERHAAARTALAAAEARLAKLRAAQNEVNQLLLRTAAERRAAIGKEVSAAINRLLGGAQ